MSVEKRILLSIFAGWLIAGALIFIAFIAASKKIAMILLWNVGLFVALAGNGPLLGYDAQGNPMYEGTPVHFVFGLLGILSGFLIYPMIVFVILSVAGNFYPKKIEVNLQ